MNKCPQRVSKFAALLLAVCGIVNAAPSFPDRVEKESATAPRIVNKTTGPYFTIGDALADSSAGGVVKITDSSVYYEKVVVSNDLSGLSIIGASPERPVISGENLPGSDSVVEIDAPNVKIDGVNIYVGGALYGVETRAGPTHINDVTFDVHSAPRGGYSTWGIIAGADIDVQNSNFLGPDSSQSSGGIISQGSSIVHINVATSDFWGVGTTGGAIGTALPVGSSVTVVESAFGQSPGAPAVVGINSWGSASATLNEELNSFRNIQLPIRGFGGAQLNPSDVVTTGSATPSVSPTGVSEQLVNSIIESFGCSSSPDLSYPSASDITRYLNRIIISDGYDLYSDREPFAQSTIDTLDLTKPRIWQQYVVSWGRQFDKSFWMLAKNNANEIRSRPNLGNLIFGGYLMEAMSKNAINNTPMSHDAWLRFAYYFPDAAARPLVAKWVKGRRTQAHWFNYNAMLGIGIDHWASDYSIPNLQSSEGVLYYLYVAKEMIDSGINAIQIAQPQLTFGQGDLAYDVHGNEAFRDVTKFIKIYGACRGHEVDGHKFVLSGVASVYHGFRGDADNIDYTMTPAGANAYGVGLEWLSLADAFTKLPPSTIRIGSKPHVVQLDNFGDLNDHMSVFSHASPRARNQWLFAFDAAVTNAGFHLAMPAFRPVIGGQNFDGFPTPPEGLYLPGLFIPVPMYGGPASTESQIFAPR